MNYDKGKFGDINQIRELVMTSSSMTKQAKGLFGIILSKIESGLYLDEEEKCFYHQVREFLKKESEQYGKKN